MSGKGENAGCLGALFGLGAKKSVGSSAGLHVRDDFLSQAEAAFYRKLVQAVGNSALVFAKVRMADVLFLTKGEGRQGAFNSISRKHVDFLLCDPRTFKILGAIELDDKSHEKADRVKRDQLVANAFAIAGLPLVRVPAKASYNVEDLQRLLNAYVPQPAPRTAPATPSAIDAAPPQCPKCGTPMVLRTSRNAPEGAIGSEFWGCTNYPRCRETRPAALAAPAPPITPG